MEYRITVDTRALQFLVNAVKGKKIILEVHAKENENGFEKTFEEKFKDQLDGVSETDRNFAYAYFVSTIVSTDVTIYLYNLSNLSIERGDSTLTSAYNAYAPTINNIISLIDKVNGLCNDYINYNTMETEEDKQKMLRAQMDVIGAVYTMMKLVIDISGTIIHIGEYVEWCDEMLQSISEYTTAILKLSNMLDSE